MILKELFMCKKILILCLVLSLTDCSSTQVAELSTTAVESKIETNTVAETTTIVETSEEIKETVETTAEETTVEETTIPDKWAAGYSDELREIIAKYEGKDYQTSRKITNDELNKIHSAGFYMISKGVSQTRGADDITRSTGGNTEFVIKQDLENFVASTFVKEKGGFDPTGYATYDAETNKIMRNAQTEILKGSWKAREDSREEKARTFVKKNEDPNNPAQYINALGNGNYIEKCGLVVPSIGNYKYFETLRGEEATNYKYVEWMCFKENNKGKITLVSDLIPRAKYKENTFEDNGEGNVGLLLWVSRTPNEERVNYLGKPQYAIVSKTFPEYYDKCGGTDMAFSSWADTPNPLPYDYTYNKVADGSFKKETQFKFLIDRENW